MQKQKMNFKLLTYVTLAVVVGVVAGYSITRSQQVSTKTTSDFATQQRYGYRNGSGSGMSAGGREQQSEPNRGNCLADDCLLVDGLEYPAGELSAAAQEALEAAIDDEYKALATYNAVVAEFGSVRPFSMIKGAEEQHIASLRAIFDKYGLEVPENKWDGTVSVPASLQESCQTGVDAEIANAALYREKLLPAVGEYADISAVFTNLMNASEYKHLPAFDRCN